MATDKKTLKHVPKPKTEAKAKKHTHTGTPAKNLAPYKLMLLVTVVPRSKADFFLDLLQSYEVNMQLQLSAFGTATKVFGFFDSDREKQVLFSVIREDNVPAATAVLEEKFASIRGGKGIAFTVPFSSMVGVAAYQFLSNKR